MTKTETQDQMKLRSAPSSRSRDKCMPYLNPVILFLTIITAGGFLGFSYYQDTSNFGLDHIAITITIIAFGSAIYELVRSSRSENLTATLHVLEKLGSEDFRKSRDKTTYGKINWTVKDKFLDDGQYQDKLEIRQIMAELNQIGLLVSRNLVDKWMVLDLYHAVIIGLWENLEGVINANRKEKQFPYYMVHFEELYKASKKWAKDENTMNLKDA